MVPSTEQQQSAAAVTTNTDHNISNVLVPSQVRVSAKRRQQQHKSSHDRQKGDDNNRIHSPDQDNTLPSQVSSSSSSSSSSQEKASTTKGKKSSRRRSPQPESNRNTNTNANANANTSQLKPHRNRGRNNGRPVAAKNQHFRFGNLPDIEWGSIPMEHLRQHPRFVPLPLPEDLAQLTDLEDVRNIRQDSWQWDALHDGRCTTSQAVAALGFLEDKAGKELGIPSTWNRRSTTVYQRLQQPALRTIEEMNDVLLADNPEPQSTATNSGSHQKQNPKPWSKTNLWKQQPISDASKNGKIPKFAAEYVYKPPIQQRQTRRRRALAHENTMGLRMMWGNAQEATSVLTALNYFLRQDPNIIIKEVGMCGAGLSMNKTDGASPSSLLIGATPDAVIEHPDGRIEALEVKNHCPFVFSRRTEAFHKQFTVRELPFREPYIFPLYVPQLMLEMLCLGPNCRSAVMVRQTATAGALILRIHRDDEWIDEMLYWLQRFQQDFVEPKEEPKNNFFYDDPRDGPRYRRFLQKTKDIANNVDRIDHEPQGMIQRSKSGDSMFLD